MLKINSNFQDYYDSAIGSFPDSDVEIRRYGHIVKVPFTEMAPLGDFRGTIKNADGKDDYIRMVGFCGKWYFGVFKEFKDAEGHFLTKLVWVPWSEIVETNSTTYSKWMGKVFAKRNYNYPDPNQSEYWTKTIFEKYGPVLAIEFYKVPAMFKNANDHTIEMYVWPNLHGWGFHGAKDAYTALWEIEHWIDVHARPDDAVVPVGDDVTRLQAYGFDKKTSFRKPKEQK